MKRKSLLEMNEEFILETSKKDEEVWEEHKRLQSERADFFVN